MKKLFEYKQNGIFKIVNEEKQKNFSEGVESYKSLEDYYRSEEGKNTEEYKQGRAQLEQTAQDLRVHFSLLQQLKKDYASAPEKSTPIEQKMYNLHLKPVEDEIDSLTDKFDEITDQYDKIQDPKELRNFIVNTYRPFFKVIFRNAFKKLYPALKKFYIETKENGSMVSKPYLDILIKRTEQQVGDLRKTMEQLKRFNV